ncbi:NAD-dependent epimerase/dehydratase family protein [Candidatus Wolfebacteria bacterium]|nr:NAD-dependent epimerase/dehydratase family protein [Candidatus Magasanikbacteria bacterium]MBI5401614.1 NAD-dependent epimerase/dehydratase family protein [Candidatus Wolfebacteria bacterium]
MINLTEKNVLITGGKGFIGNFVVNNLREKRGVPANQIIIPDSKKDDLRSLENCERLIKENKINIIIHLAAIVGGVNFSNKFPATQYYNNILMDLQIVEAAKNCGVEKIVLVSSSCAYPRDTSYPLKEENLWNGLPQETNCAYGIGKRILTVQAEAYFKQYGLNSAVILPNNAYGPGDNFDPENSHVIPSLIRKCLEKQMPLIVWGDGTPTRDFLYVEDFAEGAILAAEKMNYEDGSVNLGSGTETSVKELVAAIMELTEYKGEAIYDHSKPGGQPKRSVNIEKAQKILGFEPRHSLKKGLKETIEWYKNQTHA